MAITLTQWLERQLREVDEDGRNTAQLILQAGDGGQVWDRWDSPLRESEKGPGPIALAQIIEEVIDAAAEEWPNKRSHQVMITALDRNGAERGRWVKSVKGKSSVAKESMLASESVQHAQAMQAHTDTMKVLLAAANGQVMLLQAMNEKLMDTVSALTDKLLNNKIQTALESEQQSVEVQREMWDVAQKIAPEVMTLLANKFMSPK